MKIKKTTVTKITLTEVPHLDPISIFAEEYPNAGKITIECFGDAWSYYWGSIGERSIMEFFCQCDNYYLISKFSPFMHEMINDDDADISEHARKYIIQRRKEDSIDKEDARILFNRADDVSIEMDQDFMCEVFGDEWWDSLPQKSNSKWEYLCRILDASKEGIKTLISFGEND